MLDKHTQGTSPTREEILALPTGAALDEMIIEQVLGWCKTPLGKLREGTRYPDKIVWDTLRGPYAERPLGEFRPSLLLSESWYAVHALRKRGWYSQHTDLTLDSGAEWWSWTFLNHAPPGNESVSATAETAALAICRAALLVLLSAEVGSADTTKKGEGES